MSDERRVDGRSERSWQRIIRDRLLRGMVTMGAPEMEAFMAAAFPPPSSGPSACCRAAVEALEQIAKMPCIEELLGDEYPDGCGCARCIARSAISAVSGAK